MNPNNKDNPKTAPESGDPLATGRSRGRPVDDDSAATGEETPRAADETISSDDTSEAPESGRHRAVTPSTRPNLGAHGV